MGEEIINFYILILYFRVHFMKNAYFALLHSWLQQFVRLRVTLCNLVTNTSLHLVIKFESQCAFSDLFNFENNLQENYVFHVLLKLQNSVKFCPPKC